MFRESAAVKAPNARVRTSRSGSDAASGSSRDRSIDSGPEFVPMPANALMAARRCGNRPVRQKRSTNSGGKVRPSVASRRAASSTLSAANASRTAMVWLNRGRSHATPVTSAALITSQSTNRRCGRKEEVTVRECCVSDAEI